MSKNHKKMPLLMNKDLLKQFTMNTEKYDIEKLIQIIPNELMLALKTEAKIKAIDLDLEVALRLAATFIYPKVFGCTESMEQMILQKQFNLHELRKESNLKRQTWLYLFELEKLKLWVEFETKLPKKFKENFSLINVDKELPALRAAKQKRDHDH